MTGMTAAAPVPSASPSLRRADGGFDGYVDGDAFVLDPQWVASLTSLAVTSPRAVMHTTVTPMNGRPLARVPTSSVADVDVAIAGARAAQRFWALLPVASRAQIVRRLHDLLLKHQIEMLDLIQLETGATRLDAFEEIVQAASVCRFYARRAAGYLRPKRRPGVVPGLTQVVELRQPKGVVGIVTPWNEPLSVGVADAIPALLAGNAVVVRPNSKTPLTWLFFVDLLQRAGMPQRVLQVVLGDGASIGQALLDRVEHVCFTGSTTVGRTVAHHAAQRLVATTLALGGSNAIYVAADADLAPAVAASIRAGFGWAGQRGVAVSRLILHADIAAAFLARLVPSVAALRIGRALTFDTDLGSLSGQKQLDRVEQHVEQARALGARILTGGRARADLGPWFYEPTVIADVTPAMQVYRGLTFGPVLVIHVVTDDQAAIALANDGLPGLVASVWTRDRARGRVLAGALRAGAVTINDGYAAAVGSVSATTGTLTSAGVGRRHGAPGIVSFTEAKTVATQRVHPLAVPRGWDPQRFAQVVTAGMRIGRAVGRR